jgi:serine/threonine-protein kinase
MRIAEQLSNALRDRYRIEREIGSGGMATVYLARDVRHERFVALKVLNPELAAVLGVERFLAEIKVTANLQHPNLLPLFDSGEANGHLFYVMPFVEGESLRARLAREKQLSIAEAVHIAVSVAGALDYAHAHGVVHRDLKPENILLQAGEPLVADFGIALAVSNAGGARVTQTGISLGTPQYMSPEQATGDRTIDRRSDVYSLGAVLYEMLVGDPPHTGSTAQAIIARVLTDKPRSVRVFRDSVPEHIADAVDAALAKLPADRFATAAEFAQALAGKSVVIPAGALTPSRRRSYVRDPRSWITASALAIAAAAIATLSVATTLRPRESDEHPLLRAAILPPPGEDFAGGEGMALSNDGTMLAFIVLRASPRPRLFVRPLSSDVAREIPGTADATFPFWSPDNKQIGFFVEDELRIVDIDGRSTPSSIAHVSSPVGGTWASNGTMLFASDPGVIYRVRPGEDPVAVTKHGSEGAHTLPRFLPDARHFLFATRNGHVFVGDVRDGTQRQLASGSSAAFVPPDHLLLDVFTSIEFGRLSAVPFDAVHARITGDPVVVADSIYNPGGFTSYAVSATGVLAFQKDPPNRVRLWLDRHGTPIDSIGRDSAWTYRLSHDGKSIAQAGYVVSVRDLRRGMTLTLPTGSRQRGVLVRPVWAPDDSRVAFLSLSGASTRVEVVRADGTSEPVVIGEGLQPLDWTSDGRSVLANGRASTTNSGYALWLLDVDSNKPPTKPWLVVSGNISAARFSPNGRWVAYQSDETGSPEVYVRPFPGPGPPVRVSPSGGGAPTWRADGRELYYLTPAGDLDAVSVTTEAKFDAGPPQLLFRGVTRQPFTQLVTQYDVTPDGQRFLVYTENRAPAPPLTVLAPWQRLLPRH